MKTIKPNIISEEEVSKELKKVDPLFAYRLNQFLNLYNIRTSEDIDELDDLFYNFFEMEKGKTVTHSFYDDEFEIKKVE